jgi:phage baseplate assembly protein W
MAEEIKLNPLDFEPDVAIGIDLPLNTSKGGSFKLNYLSIDQAVANSKNLLLTDRGERIMQPTFGCDLRRSLFENLTTTLIESLDAKIRSSFDYWLPYININELILTPNEDKNILTIKLVISLEGNQFDTRSIQLEIRRPTV